MEDIRFNMCVRCNEGLRAYCSTCLNEAVALATAQVLREYVPGFDDVKTVYCSSPEPTTKSKFADVLARSVALGKVPTGTYKVEHFEGGVRTREIGNEILTYIRYHGASLFADRDKWNQLIRMVNEDGI